MTKSRAKADIWGNLDNVTVKFVAIQDATAARQGVSATGWAPSFDVAGGAVPKVFASLSLFV